VSVLIQLGDGEHSAMVLVQCETCCALVAAARGDVDDPGTPASRHRQWHDELRDQLSTLATVVTGLAGGDVDVDDYMAAHAQWAAPREGQAG
jgi:hypothetical protein